MPSANTGKLIIKSIKICQDHVTLSFAKNEKVQISKEAYLSTYLYQGKQVSQKEINKLIEITAFSSLLNYALSLISKRHFSEKKMIEKLKAKDNNQVAIKSVINKLKQNDLLNDKEYMTDLMMWDDERSFGKNKIIKHLLDQGIPEELVNKAHFPASNELKKAKGLIPKLERKYQRYAYENKKKHIYQALLVQGYEYEIAKAACQFVKEDKPKVEKQKLLKDFQTIKRRYEKKYEGYELKQKIYGALASKGYKHSEIKNVLEGYSHENDF